MVFFLRRKVNWKVSIEPNLWKCANVFTCANVCTCANACKCVHMRKCMHSIVKESTRGKLPYYDLYLYMLPNCDELPIILAPIHPFPPRPTSTRSAYASTLNILYIPLLGIVNCSTHKPPSGQTHTIPHSQHSTLNILNPEFPTCRTSQPHSLPANGSTG